MGASASRFRILSDADHVLWDFGWFALTRFAVEAVGPTPPAARERIDQFLRDPISRRSYCTRPDPWGAPIEQHGPFLSPAMSTDWYRPVALHALAGRVERVIAHPDFRGPLAAESRAAIDAWIDVAVGRGDDTFALEAPTRPDVRVEWAAMVWWLFEEFVSVSPARDELTVAVFGYD